MIDRRTALSLAFACSALVAGGCHRKDATDIPRPVSTVSPGSTATATATATASTSASPTPTATPTLTPASAMTTFSVAAGGGSVSLSSSGYGGALSYPANNATTASGSFTLSTSPTGSIPAPAPSGTPILYFTMQLSNSVAFVGNFATSPVTLPSSISTTGLTFVETLYDQTMGVEIGSPVTGIVSGQSVSFGSVTSGSFSASAGDVYLFVISHN